MRTIKFQIQMLFIDVLYLLVLWFVGVIIIMSVCKEPERNFNPLTGQIHTAEIPQ